MKNLALNLAIALVIIAYIGGASFGSKEEKRASVNSQNKIETESKTKNREDISSNGKESDINTTLKKQMYTTGIASVRIERVVVTKNKTRKIYLPESIENNLPERIQKTIDEVIAQDNAIIGNSFSNETEATNESIDAIAFKASEKTIEEIIAEDNTITENNFSNVTEEVNVSIDAIAFKATEKTIEEIITEDNAITENNFSN